MKCVPSSLVCRRWWYQTFCFCIRWYHCFVYVQAFVNTLIVACCFCRTSIFSRLDASTSLESHHKIYKFDSIMKLQRPHTCHNRMIILCDTMSNWRAKEGYFRNAKDKSYSYIICHDMTLYERWYDMIWYDMIWYDMIWCDVMWCDVMW